MCSLAFTCHTSSESSSSFHEATALAKSPECRAPSLLSQPCPGGEGEALSKSFVVEAIATRSGPLGRSWARVSSCHFPVSTTC